jgi:hypothetical protein
MLALLYRQTGSLTIDPSEVIEDPAMYDYATGEAFRLASLGVAHIDFAMWRIDLGGRTGVKAEISSFGRAVCEVCV